MEFKDMLRSRILEILNAWPVRDQYAIMFFLYPNECFTYGEYENLTEFDLLYRCESEIQPDGGSAFGATEAEQRWNPAYWDDDARQSVISFDEENPIADALIDWYEATGVQNIGEEDFDAAYDDEGSYIGTGPGGLPELLQLVTEIAAELQRDGVIEARFGRKLPILLADLEFTWYMVRATRAANPNGETDEYLRACVEEGFADKNMLQ